MGQFTQPDPIGIVGGLNSYGFAAGDPVSYSDPYGLCPDPVRVPGGLCPGGLTNEQWNSVLEGIETLEQGEASILQQELEEGRISARELGETENAHTVWTLSGVDNSRVLNTRPGVSFFDLLPGDRGFVLSHERGHELQNVGSYEEREALRNASFLQIVPGWPRVIGISFSAGLEMDADRHACAHASNPVIYAHRC